MSKNSGRSAGHNKQQGGFSLIELMTVILLVSVLIAMAGPAFRGAVDRSKIRSTTADLMGSLNAARARALSGNRGITVISFAGTGAWHTASGADHTKGGWCVTSAADCTSGVYESHEVDTGVTVAAAVPTSLTFAGDGTLKVATKVDFTICKTGSIGNVLTVGVSGRISVDPTTGVCGP